MPARGGRRFDLIEVLALIAMAAVTAGAAVWWVLGDQPTMLPTREEAEYAWLESTYGPEKNSLLAEEWIVRDFFQDRKGGFFVDVGAGHHQRYSNTYYLERALDWSGIAVDAIQEFQAGYTEHRPQTAFFGAFVSDSTGETAQLFLSAIATEVASGSRQFTERWGDLAETREVPTVTLTDLLDGRGVERVDFVSMDIELSEPAGLAGFDIRRFRPTLVCVEAHPEVRQEIIRYFHGRDYVVVGKYLRVDRFNLYFMPLDHAVSPFPAEVVQATYATPR